MFHYIDYVLNHFASVRHISTYIFFGCGFRPGSPDSEGFLILKIGQPFSKIFPKM